MRILGIAALGAALLASPVAAQDPAPTDSAAAPAAATAAAPVAAPQPAPRDGLSGTRVRVTAPNFFPTPVQGTVTAYTQQGLTVAREDTAASFTVPLRAISRLDRYAGGSAASTAWYRGRAGAFLGAGLGLIVGPVASKLTGQGMGESALLGGVAGLTAGFTIGAIYGAASPRDRWTWAMQPWGYDPALRPAAATPSP